MKILLLGNGGREHALAWKMAQSPLCSKLYFAPGNAGTAEYGENVAIDPEDNSAIYELVLDRSIDMVVVGPEAPLVNGVWNYLKRLRSTSHVPVIGPSMQGAKLEGSKAYAKRFMQEFGIPTAGYREFNTSKAAAAIRFINKKAVPPIVLKADGLAAGKGVVICPDKEEALRELQEMLSGKFGQASRKVVIEEFLSGIEFSVFALTDGRDYKILPVAKDYKRVGEGDTGPNTGGMGAVSPPPFVDEKLMQKVEDRIIRPTILGLQKRGIEYQGFLFFGLIKVGDDPFVIEYNCRLGDPETEVVLPRVKNDLVELFLAVKDRRLAEMKIIADERTATTIMLVSGGYPGSYEKGKVITGIENVKDSMVFHAGTTSAGGKILTNGGRVIAVTSLGRTFQDALVISNKNATAIEFEGKYFRKDIGFDL
ncbi:MAG: phosphoribosylamine--glycine ligase [Lewinellaceae bacterium]|nr:phosphoribosylamine--glycine ligase [Saprospiraceae bacterium]MCB9339704.1 phosphoribosylamine--glycine ligase [Lewinellaceae bacterium]